MWQHPLCAAHTSSKLIEGDLSGRTSHWDCYIAVSTTAATLGKEMGRELWLLSLLLLIR